MDGTEDNESILDASNIICSLPSEAVNKDPKLEILGELVKDRKLFQIEEMLSKSDLEELDLNSVDQHGLTLLGYAAKLGFLDIAQCLLKHGCSPRRSDYFKMTPLHYAAENGHVDVAHLLLISGADVNSIERPSTSALHIAACKGWSKLAELLIKQGADVNQLDSLGMSALQGAAANGQLATVKVLVEAGANKNVKNGKNERTALFLAAQVNHQEIVEYLLEHNARVNLVDDYGMTPFCAMCIQNNTTLAKSLLQAGSKVNRPDKKKSLPIHYTARNGNNELTELLIQGGSAMDMLNSYFETPLHMAVRMGHTETAKILVKNGCDTNLCEPYAHVTALHVAIDRYQDEKNFEAVLRVLIEGGCWLDSRAFSSLETPLYRAVDLRKAQFAIVLLQHGADPSVECPFDTTILNKACQRKMDDLVSFLVDCDIDWRKETWLNKSMSSTGVESSEETLPSILTENMKLLHAIIELRMNTVSLKQLCRLTIRKAMRTKLWLKVDSLFLPHRLKDYLMMKVG